MNTHFREGDRTETAEQAYTHERLWADVQNGSQMPDGQMRQWTFAVDLKQIVEGRHTVGPTRGAAYAAEQLKKLAEDSAGKPVTFVVQALVQKNLDYMLERFVVEDGKVTPLNDGKTAKTTGFQQDTTDLLHHATEEFPATKYGFIIFSHGQGNNGVYGNTGKASLSELRSAIKDGLPDGQQLELLDFTSCDMAQDGMLESMRGLTKNIIASPTPENVIVDESVNGEDVNVWLKKALEHPETDGYQLAHEAIEAVSNAKDQKAVTTLAHFDMTKYPEFAASLNNFGDVMSETMRDQNNRSVSLSFLHSVTNYLSPGAPVFDAMTFRDNAFLAQTRDLGSFVNEVSNAVARGAISDPNSSLQDGAADLSHKLKELIPDYFGAKIGSFNYQKQASGLSVFLPETAVLDTETSALRGASSSFEFCEGTKLKLQQNDLKYLEDLTRMAIKDAGATAPLVQALADQIAHIRTRFGNYRSEEVQADPDYKIAAQKICDETASLVHAEPFASEYTQYKTELDKRRQDALNRQLAPSVAGWQRFVNTWYGYTNPDALTP